MKVRTAEQYLALYRRRGQTQQPKTRRSDVTCTEAGTEHEHPWDVSYRSKPNHAARAVALPLMPLGARPHPQQPTHPATLPMDDWTRRWVYAAQRGEAAGATIPPEMTPRQWRRYVKKSRHHAARKDQP